MRYISRDIRSKIDNFIEDPEILAIRGPRQAGKTTLMQNIREGIAKKHGPSSTHYINLEDDIELAKLKSDPKEYIEYYLRGRDKLFLFIDEVQYLDKAGHILKLLFDTYPGLKIIVSGSSSLDLTELGRHLVGRVIFFELYPFNFAEFLRAKDDQAYNEYLSANFNLNEPKSIKSVHIDKLNKYLREYVTYGGYPRIVLEEEPAKKLILLKNLYITYIEKDIIKTYGIEKREEVTKILKLLAATNSLINYSDITGSLDINFKTLKRILAILKDTYVLYELRPFHKNLATELKKAPMFYFYDLGLRNMLTGSLETESYNWGTLYENYVLLRYKEGNIKYWRTKAKAEVDFVVTLPGSKIVPIESKITPKVTRSYISFLTEYKVNFGIIANLTSSNTQEKVESTIYEIPYALL